MELPLLMIMMNHNYWKAIENPNQRSIRERFVVTRKSLKRERVLMMVIHSYLKTIVSLFQRSIREHFVENHMSLERSLLEMAGRRVNHKNLKKVQQMILHLVPHKMMQLD